MGQYALHHPWIVDDRDQTEVTAALRARQYVEPKAPGHQLGPEHVGSSPPGRRSVWLAGVR